MSTIHSVTQSESVTCNYSNPSMSNDCRPTTGGFTSTRTLNGPGVNVAPYQAAAATDIIYMVIGVIGMTGNMSVVIIISFVKKMRKRITNLYILSQSCLDLLVSFFLCVTSIPSTLPADPLAADIYCRLWISKYLLWSVMLSSTYSLVTITLERYFAVVHPILHKTSFTRSKALTSIVIVWMIGPIFQIYFFLTSGVVGRECLVYSIWPNETTRKVIGTTIVFMQFLIPLMALFFSYTKIVYVITHRIQAVHPAGNTTSDQTQVSVLSTRPSGSQAQHMPDPNRQVKDLLGNIMNCNYPILSILIRPI